MRSPFNYAANKFAKHVANSYARSRRRRKKPEPNGSILGFLFLIIVLMFILATITK